LTKIGTGEDVAPADADDAGAARGRCRALPELLGRETAAALSKHQQLTRRSSSKNFHAARPMVAFAGCDAETLGRPEPACRVRPADTGGFCRVARPSWRRSRFALVASSRPLGHLVVRRMRMIVAVAKQGFDLCGARDRSEQRQDRRSIDRRTAPPWICHRECSDGASDGADSRACKATTSPCSSPVSGTGKELIARAIHVGSHRSSATFLP
jgi:hypothetical protein